MRQAMLPMLLFVLLPGPAMAAEPQLIEIRLDHYKISPDRIFLRVDQPVTFSIRNEDSFIAHDFVINTPGDRVDLKIELDAGKTGRVSFTPTRTGRYDYYCDKAPPIGPSHREKGMHGLLVVY